jgi:hypothetical protein
MFLAEVLKSSYPEVDAEADKTPPAINRPLIPTAAITFLFISIPPSN